MIYLDCAATSLQKPRSVPRAVVHAMQTMSSPGRGGYPAAMRAADTVFRCREEIAALFHAPGPETVVFTMNATHALNIAIRSLAGQGSRVVISGYEHNAVLRPLYQIGANIKVADSELFEPEKMLASFRRALPGADLVVCTHVSNVFGYILPIEEIAQLCKHYSVPLIVDASQSAGSIEIDFGSLGATFLAMPGHKGLLGPQGTGVLLCAIPGTPLLAGGTGSASEEPNMPEELPERQEAGTHNTAGIAGLLEGVRYVARRGPSRIGCHERGLMHLAATRLKTVPGLTVYAAALPSLQSGVLSVRSDQMDSEVLAAKLGNAGIAVRAGLHCAPLAHQSAGTISAGTVRLSFSPFNTSGEIICATDKIREILNKL